MSDEEYKPDFDELRRIYRLETKSPKLCKLNPLFYKSLKKFLSEEKNRYVSSMESSFSPSNIKRLENIKKMIITIRDIRIKKCMNMCLMYSRTNDFKDEGLIDFEVDFAKGMLKLIDKQAEQTDLLFGITKESKKEECANLIKLEFLQKIPSFIGSDMKEYGPFEEHQVCELPMDVCEILCAKNLAKKVE